jgi:hypothetical protein
MLSPQIEEEEHIYDNPSGIGVPNPKQWRALRNRTERNRAAQRRKKARRDTKSMNRHYHKMLSLMKYHGKDKNVIAKRQYECMAYQHYVANPPRLYGPASYTPCQHSKYPFRPLLHVRFDGTIQCHGSSAWDGHLCIAEWNNGQPLYLYDSFGDFLDHQLSSHPSIITTWQESLSHYAVTAHGSSSPDTTVLIRASVSLIWNYIGGKAVSVKRWRLSRPMLSFGFRGTTPGTMNVYNMTFSPTTSWVDGTPSLSDLQAETSRILQDPHTPYTYVPQGTYYMRKAPDDPLYENDDYWRDLLLSGLRYDEQALYHLSGKDLQRRAPKVLQDAIANSFSDAISKIPVCNQNFLKTLTLTTDCMKLLVNVKNGDLSALDDAIEHASRATGKPYSYFLKRFFTKHNNRVTFIPMEDNTKEAFVFIDNTRKVWSQKGLSDAFSSTIDKVGHGKLETFRQTWFTGRYIWSTTWMQMGQFYKYMESHALTSLRYALHKIYSRYLEFDPDSGARIKCSVSYREKVLEGMLKLQDRMYRTGTMPNRYILWDIVPFSFVVDWFVPIGSGLAASDRYTQFSPLYIEYPEKYDYSIRYDYTVRGVHCDVYFRFKQKTYPEFDLGSYILNWTNVVKKKGAPYGLNGEAVVGQRLLDSVMLITQYL